MCGVFMGNAWKTSSPLLPCRLISISHIKVFRAKEPAILEYEYIAKSLPANRVSKLKAGLLHKKQKNCIM